MFCPECGYYFEKPTDMCFACGWILDYQDDNIGSGNSQVTETRFDVETDVDMLVIGAEDILSDYTMEEWFALAKLRTRKLEAMMLNLDPFQNKNLSNYGGVTERHAYRI